MKIVYQTGLDHIYRRLVNLGLPSARALLAMHLSAVISGYLAFTALLLPPLRANAIFAVALLVGLFLLFWLEQEELR
jgi:hypothetical protein